MPDTQAILTRHGLTGALKPVGGLYILNGERGGQGAYVQFDAEPDDALIEQAAVMIVDELNAERVGR